MSPDHALVELVGVSKDRRLAGRGAKPEAR